MEIEYQNTISPPTNALVGEINNRTLQISEPTSIIVRFVSGP